MKNELEKSSKIWEYLATSYFLNNQPKPNKEDEFKKQLAELEIYSLKLSQTIKEINEIIFHIEKKYGMTPKDIIERGRDLLIKHSFLIDLYVKEHVIPYD